ncbi:DNA phosphorothioation-associated protein 4 [Ruegeria sp. HKCCA5929]|uniref:DNA phosphorothioation-associated protein 4 n=1 Tax=Ruegeria sp. HKCCA5929 TaxID=2682988 RepID=UPI001487EFF3|nr:DNA phosphorothioation-associated protein 4 [Ruegeria sp. HKCCA5929]
MSSRSPNINRSRVYEDIVQRLSMQKLPGADRTLFPTIRELLCFAALLGHSEKRRLPLDREAGVEDVSYQQFERGDAEDLIYLIALAETKDPEILKDGEESRCAEIFEEYANGGLQIIHEAMNRGGGEYPDRDILEVLKELGYLSVEDEEPDVSGISF